MYHPQTILPPPGLIYVLSMINLSMGLVLEVYDVGDDGPQCNSEW